MNELPLRIDKLSIIDVPMKKTEIITPGTVESSIKKEAVKLIVIRRHKMRKHKLKKLRKKMKFEWAKVSFKVVQKWFFLNMHFVLVASKT